MGLSRPARITILLAIDVVFFLVELIVGYAVGSLALVADSFHMLNDVMSLLVALYAIKLTNNKHDSDSRYSYGWHRAEILAALVNGVFLLALCFSISLEAIERFFSVPEISNPRLVVVVGSLGLASNLVGLFLFHEHSHSHPPSPSRPHSPNSNSSNSPVSGTQTPTHTKSQATVEIAHSHSASNRASTRSPLRSTRLSSTPLSAPSSDSPLYGHPVATRASLVQTANEIARARSPSPPPRRREYHHRSSIDSVALVVQDNAVNGSAPVDLPLDASESQDIESTPLLPQLTRGRSPGSTESAKHAGHSHGGHAHGSMNMRALVLHVIGDALGNVGVIATGLIIWLTTWEYKYFCDPIISLVITVIIFSSALPLVKSASFILLQGVPPTVSLDEVRESILSIDGVLSLHELHVWQLSESKLVASVHVLTSRAHDFMPIGVKIREILHHLGIHSCTIQPEYHSSNFVSSDPCYKTAPDTSCLILCPADEVCNPSEHACCPPPTTEV